MENKNGIFIPYLVLCNKNLLPSAKILFGIIANYVTQHKFCELSNNEFAEYFNTSRVTISNWLNQLEQQEFIYRDSMYDARNNIKIRKIFVNQSKVNLTPKVNLADQSKVDFTYSNTNNNNINNNINNNNSNTYSKPNLTITDLTEKSYPHIVKLFPTETQPKSNAKIQEWKTIIQELANDGYSQQDVYKICKVVRENDFWHDKFMTIKQLVKTNKNGITNIDYFLFKFSDDVK